MEMILLWPEFPEELCATPTLCLSHYPTLKDAALKLFKGARFSRMAV